jgi:hypothetical protein
MQKEREAAATGKKALQPTITSKSQFNKISQICPKIGIDFPSSCAIF